MMAEGYEIGFAFLPGAAIDQHFTQRDRYPDLLPVIRRHPKLLGIGIDEGTAVVVQGSRAEIIGLHSAHFVSGRHLSNFGDDVPFETSRAICRRAFDLGITHFDLANNYGPPPGAAEKTFAKVSSAAPGGGP